MFMIKGDPHSGSTIHETLGKVDHLPSSKNFIAKLRVSGSIAAGLSFLSLSIFCRHSFSIFNIF